MAKRTLTEDQLYAKAVGERLRNVINAYYGSIKAFAEKTQIDQSTVSRYLNGTLFISDKVANNLQVIVNINKDYLFNGNLPMVLDDKIKPIKEHLVEKQDMTAADIILSRVDKNRETIGLVTWKGSQNEIHSNIDIIPYYVVETRGQRDIIAEQGKIYMVGIAISGVKKACAIYVQSSEFIERYKTLFPLKLNCHIILDRYFENGDDVLVTVNDTLYLATLDNKDYEPEGIESHAYYKYQESLFDCATNKWIDLRGSWKFEIHGAYYSTIIKGRLK